MRIALEPQGQDAAAQREFGPGAGAGADGLVDEPGHVVQRLRGQSGGGRAVGHQEAGTGDGGSAALRRGPGADHALGGVLRLLVAGVEAVRVAEVVLHDVARVPSARDEGGAHEHEMGVRGPFGEVQYGAGAADVGAEQLRLVTREVQLGGAVPHLGGARGRFGEVFGRQPQRRPGQVGAEVAHSLPGARFDGRAVEPADGGLDALAQDLRGAPAQHRDGFARLVGEQAPQDAAAQESACSGDDD